MISQRLKEICDFLSPYDSIIDIGCDHAYVCIEMSRRGCQKILATDIHEGALKIANENILKEGLEKKIEMARSDGLKNISTKLYNAIVIAGMGTSTIKHILKEKEKLETIETIILQSNNDLRDLREFMNRMNYKLTREKVIREKNHYYTIMKYTKGIQDLQEIELEFGLFSKENKEYYEHLRKHYQTLLKKINQKNSKYSEIKNKLSLLQNYL